MTDSAGQRAQDARIDVCVCTYRRRELETTLRSLGAIDRA